jgi:hypothetical protein
VRREKRAKHAPADANVGGQLVDADDLEGCTRTHRRNASSPEVIAASLFARIHAASSASGEEEDGRRVIDGCALMNQAEEAYLSKDGRGQSRDDLRAAMWRTFWPKPLRLQRSFGVLLIERAADGTTTRAA